MEGQASVSKRPDMPKPCHRLNSTSASLLGFLHEGPMTGWDLAATAQRVIGNFWTLTPSQVYRELAAMADARLVRAGERGPRERQPYTLTPAGREAFQEWLENEPGPENIRFPLLLTIEFGRHLSRERLATFVHHHRAAHARKLADYQQLHDAALASGHHDPYAMATVEFGIGHERAALDWFDQLPPEIRGRQRWDNEPLASSAEPSHK